MIDHAWNRERRMDRWVEIRGPVISNSSHLIRISHWFATQVKAEYEWSNRSLCVQDLKKGSWHEIHLDDLKGILRLVYSLGYRVKVIGPG